MNERIRELAEQAGLKYHNWITNESNINDGTFPYPRLEDYEQFAQLIVKECCEVLEQTEDALDRQKWPTPRGCVKYIKDYFGVGE
jgi:hypothetical protein